MKALPLLLLAAAAACSKKEPSAPAPASAGKTPAPAATPAPARDERLGRTFDFAVKALKAVGAGGAPAAAFANFVDVRQDYLGDPTAYLASVSEGASYAPMNYGMSPRPQSVHFQSGPGKGDYTVEQYEDDVAKPVRSEIVNVVVAR